MFDAFIAIMRTTVTIDADTELLLKEETTRTGKSFKVVLNESIRKALAKGEHCAFVVEPLSSHPYPSEWEGMSFNKLADALDDEETLRELYR